ncbi:aminodeoxychorismate/anthranilate synthase component II [Sulfobacillus thermosulfidooxidans]|uniref:anthranilate synthase component II n=1 Tax=Sulfobacillus thermosulfidooxidans TaxID=28034 RepID=UPI003100DE05
MAVILVLDNYDSFTYNLVQYLGMLGHELRVVRNDEVSVDEIRQMNPSRIVLSPGPGRPEDAGIMVDLIRALGPEIPILGVCLGHQAIAYAFGGEVGPAVRLMHGKDDKIFHNEEDIFRGLPQGFLAGRYHSLAVNVESSNELEVTAKSSDGTVMAIRHRSYPIFGIQFHPESVLTPLGMDILKNFLELSEAAQSHYQGEHRYEY